MTSDMYSPSDGTTPWGGTDLHARFAAQMGALLGPEFPTSLGLAVSGGGDSMAMLHLAAPWARAMGLGLRVATVDHGLRAESAAEAALVARVCAELQVPHSTLLWKGQAGHGWDGKGNLSAAARAARHQLLDQWRGSMAHILFAHTRDDQAETVLMRLARGSGVEGLSGMASTQMMSPPPLPGGQGGWMLLRPLLDTTRAELRHFLKVLHIPYVDDPTNDDPKYDRVKARQALQALACLGITVEGVAQTAVRMSRARDALQARATEVAKTCVLQAHYEVQLDRDRFAALERDTQLRLLARGLQTVASNPYRPRSSALEAVLDRALAGGDGVLHGAQVLVRRDRIWLIREAKALQGHDVAVLAGGGGLWDRRFACSGSVITGSCVRALGEAGLAQLPQTFREAIQSIPRAALIVTPAIFDDETLIACARLTFGPPYSEIHVPNPQMFTSS